MKDYDSLVETAASRPSFLSVVPSDPDGGKRVAPLPADYPRDCGVDPVTWLVARNRLPEAWAVLYKLRHETAQCFSRRLTPKIRYWDWACALRAAYMLLGERGGHMRYPFRCRLGHVHIGALPNGRHMLTGGR